MFGFSSKGLVQIALAAGLLAACSKQEPVSVSPQSTPQPQTESEVVKTMNLPKSVGVWTCRSEPRTITAETIFEYMDGAGELYLGYHFDRLDVYKYDSEDQKEILVELYWMKSSDDAYGLLSNDWAGESVALAPGDDPAERRAIYGAGLLRLWSDNLYARIMVYRETDESRSAVMELGESIVQGRRKTQPPALVNTLPPVVGEDYRLEVNHAVYLHSDIVLNSVYFLSAENILNLNASTEVVSSDYVRSATETYGPRIRVLVVQYPDPGSAQEALKNFRTGYIPEIQIAGESEDRSVIAVDSNWLGYHRTGRVLALAFDCPSQEITERFLSEIVKRIQALEVAK